MNIQVFLFKLFIVLYYICILTLVSLPIAYALVFLKNGGFKYGFTFIQASFNVALFGAFSFAFLMVMYHALSFEVLGKVPLSNYLRTRQKVKVRGSASMQALHDKIAKEMKVRNMSISGEHIQFRKLAYFVSPDRVSIRREGDLFTIESKPFSSLWFIDFGRNYSTVRKIAQWIKQISE